METSATVAITGANSLVGRELLDRLAQRGQRTTALVRKPLGLPAEEVVDDWTSSPRTPLALAAADVVVHLTGEISAKDAAGYEAANVAPARLVAAAARPGQRVLFISYPGADPEAANLFLRAKGRAERLLTTCPAEAVVFRTQIIAHPLDAPGGFEEAIRSPRPGGTVRLIGDGQSLTRPIAQRDVVAALLAGIDGRIPAGGWDLVGPDAMTLDQVVELYNAHPVRISHTPGWLARLLSRVVPDLTPAFVDLFLNPSPPGDPEPLARHLGPATPLAELWARSQTART